MNIGIVGLGLIGGSMAKAIKRYTEHTVIGWDKSESVRTNAKLIEAVDTFMENGNPKDCDMVIIALYPGATIAYVEEHQKNFGDNILVVDCAGVKQIVCEAVEPIAKANNFLFCGGHPMAGVEHSGLAFSKQDMFQGASMILTPSKEMNPILLEPLEGLLEEIGFARIQFSTPKEHDEMIAYTSQLAHVVSSAYVRSELSAKFMGFSAGSFKDMTRVAKLNEEMWTELFMDNDECLANEVEELAQRLLEYSQCIRTGDSHTLKELLKEGKDIRIAIDHRKDFD